MKRIRMIVAVMALVICTAVMAENYPYRSDYLWVTTPNHADWLYETGEKATVEVQFFKYGIPQEGTVNYAVGNDMLPDDEQGSVKLKNGRALVNMGTRKTPGFRDLRLRITCDGKEYQHHVKVGFSADKIQPYTKEPADFKAFWDKAKEEAPDLYPRTGSGILYGQGGLLAHPSATQ